MKVKELIETLQGLDQEQEILIFNVDLGVDEKIQGVFQNEDGTYYI